VLLEASTIETKGRPGGTGGSSVAARGSAQGAGAPRAALRQRSLPPRLSRPGLQLHARQRAVVQQAEPGGDRGIAAGRGDGGAGNSVCRCSRQSRRLCGTSARQG